jgi:hypothetical protein
MGSPDVTVLAKPEIEKPFIAITVGEPTERVQKLIDYMIAHQSK